MDFATRYKLQGCSQLQEEIMVQSAKEFGRVFVLQQQKPAESQNSTGKA